MTASVGQVVAAVLVPPLGVFLKHGLARNFWVACIATVMGFLPGVAFALWSVLRSPPNAAGDGTPAAV
ncbi:MAG: YqaE/Pmp3 family membrane protein [Sphingomonadales bacterium]|nr:YqaE/Pmp3 family membrane protein [Sphingomonadales bacterium]